MVAVVVKASADMMEIKPLSPSKVPSTAPGRMMVAKMKSLVTSMTPLKHVSVKSQVHCSYSYVVIYHINSVSYLVQILYIFTAKVGVKSGITYGHSGGGQQPTVTTLSCDVAVNDSILGLLELRNREGGKQANTKHGLYLIVIYNYIAIIPCISLHFHLCINLK